MRDHGQDVQDRIVHLWLDEELLFLRCHTWDVTRAGVTSVV
jgi:hypothetical protein